MQARKSLHWAVRWHAPFLLLMVFLAYHSLSTFGTFVVSDDLVWVQRAAADAHQPWNVFGKPVLGDYYRPVSNLAWLTNYCLWGFDFDGHQLMFILTWLAGVCLVYAVGCRLGGRSAGFAAACLLGLNDVYLLIESWKSWYTTLTEFVVVLAWALCFMRWLDTRRRGCGIAAIALAVVALLSRELAPLIISAVFLVTVILPAFKMPGSAARGATNPPMPNAESPKGRFSRRRAAGWLAVWAVVTVGALLVLPSYRSAARGLLTRVHHAVFQCAQATFSDSAGRPARGEGAGAYVWDRFASHASGMFDFQDSAQQHGYGILRFLLWFALAFTLLRARRQRSEPAARNHRVLLGALVLGAALFGIPWGFAAFGRGADVISMRYAQPIAAALLMGVFCAAALRGDRWDRMLGAWFLASFLPVLFLEHKSGAYHLLAFTALALFTARRLPAFVEEELRPVAAQGRSRAAADADGDARRLLAGIFVLLLLVQAWMLAENVRGVGPEIRRRVQFGRAMEARVRHAVEGVLSNAAPDRRVRIAPDTREDAARYADLAGLILQEQYGFAIERLDRPDVVGLRAFDTPLRIYTDAIPYEDALFSKFNAFPNPSFEEEQPGLTRSPLARSGKYSLTTAPSGARPEDAFLDSAPFSLRPGAGYVFGGFVRREAQSAESVRMGLRAVAGAPYARETQSIAQARPEWELLWECAAPPGDATSLVFRVVEAKGVRDGCILVDDVFLCPVEPLIQAARSRK